MGENKSIETTKTSQTMPLCRIVATVRRNIDRREGQHLNRSEAVRLDSKLISCQPNEQRDRILKTVFYRDITAAKLILYKDNNS